MKVVKDAVVKALSKWVDINTEPLSVSTVAVTESSIMNRAEAFAKIVMTRPSFKMGNGDKVTGYVTDQGMLSMTVGKSVYNTGTVTMNTNEVRELQRFLDDTFGSING